MNTTITPTKRGRNGNAGVNSEHKKTVPGSVGALTRDLNNNHLDEEGGAV